jgi:hypothetical protein
LKVKDALFDVLNALNDNKSVDSFKISRVKLQFGCLTICQHSWENKEKDFSKDLVPLPGLVLNTK